MSNFNSALSAIARMTDDAFKTGVIDDVSLKPVYDFIEEIIHTALSKLVQDIKQQYDVLKGFTSFLVDVLPADILEKALAIIITLYKLVKQNLC